MKILALDLGKKKTVACEYEAASGRARYTTVKTSRDAIRDLIVECGAERMVFEIGAAAGWLSGTVQELGLELEVANTSHPAHECFVTPILGPPVLGLQSMVNPYESPSSLTESRSDHQPLAGRPWSPLAVIMLGILVPGLPSLRMRRDMVGVARFVVLIGTVFCAYGFFGPLWGLVLFTDHPNDGLYPFLATCIIIFVVSVWLGFRDRSHAFRNFRGDNPFRSSALPIASVSSIETPRWWAPAIDAASVAASLTPPVIVVGVCMAALMELPSPGPNGRLLIVGAFGIAALLAVLLGMVGLLAGRLVAATIAVALGGLELTVLVFFVLRFGGMLVL